MKKIKWITWLLILIILPPSIVLANNVWEDEGYTNIKNDRVVGADIVTYLGVPYLACEAEGKLYVKYFDGATWRSLTYTQQEEAENLNIENASKIPSVDLIVGGEKLYLVWQEDKDGFSKIYAKEYDFRNSERGWQAIEYGNPRICMNETKNCYTPKIAMYNSNPVVVWIEEESEINRVKVATFSYSSSWQYINDRNFQYNNLWNASEPSITVYANVPYIAWIEQKNNVYYLWVKRYSSGSDWGFLGGNGVNTSNAEIVSQPRIAVWNSIAYVSWLEQDKLYIKRRVNTNWQWLDSQNYSLNSKPENIAKTLDMVAYKDSIYIMWVEDDPSSNFGKNENIYVRKYNGSKWSNMDGTSEFQDASSFTPYNFDPEFFVPKLSITNNRKYIIFQEKMSGLMGGTAYKLHVKRCGEPLPTPTATVTNTFTHTLTYTVTNTPTNTPTSTATNTATFTVTSTEVNTATNTPTFTVTNTLTFTTTNTITHTPTVTNTLTNTETYTPAYTATNTATPTNTPLPTPGAYLFLSKNKFNPLKEKLELKIGFKKYRSVKVDIFSLSGKHIISWELNVDSPGEEKKIWDGRDAQGEIVGSGVYYIVTHNSLRKEIKKILVVK